MGGEGINSDQVISVEDNEIIKIGGLEFKSLHTPGHANHHIHCNSMIVFSQEM